MRGRMSDDYNIGTALSPSVPSLSQFSVAPLFPHSFHIQTCSLSHCHGRSSLPIFYYPILVPIRRLHACTDLQVVCLVLSHSLIHLITLFIPASHRFDLFPGTSWGFFDPCASIWSHSISCAVVCALSASVLWSLQSGMASPHP